MRWSDSHLVRSAPALGERRRLLFGVDDVLGSAGRMAFPATACGLLHPQGEHGEDDRGDHEDQERHAPVEVEREHARGERSDECADGVGGSMEAVHARPRLDGVVVGDQRVVSGVDHRLAERRPGPGDRQQNQSGGESGHAREHGPHEGAADHERDPLGLVRVLGDGDLQRQRCNRRQRHDRQRGGDVDVERLADLGQQNAERRAIEFVDCVEPEQHDQRERRLAAAQVGHPLLRMAHAVGEPLDDRSGLIRRGHTRLGSSCWLSVWVVSVGGPSGSGRSGWCPSGQARTRRRAGAPPRSGHEGPG